MKAVINDASIRVEEIFSVSFRNGGGPFRCNQLSIRHGNGRLLIEIDACVIAKIPVIRYLYLLSIFFHVDTIIRGASAKIGDNPEISGGIG